MNAGCFCLLSTLCKVLIADEIISLNQLDSEGCEKNTNYLCTEFKDNANSDYSRGRLNQSDSCYVSSTYDCGLCPSKRPLHLFFSGEFLYWKSSEHNLPYATDAIPTPYVRFINGVSDNFALNAIDSSKGHLYYATFDWDPGFRLTAGYESGHDQWNLYFTWTQFHNKGSQKQHASSSPNQILGAATPFASNDVTLEGFAKSDLDLDVDFYDVEVSKNFCVNSSLKMDLFIGVRTGSMHQNWQNQYTDATIQTFIPSSATFPSYFIQILTSASEYNTQSKQTYYGTGIRSGLNMKWRLFPRLSLFAKGAFSALYGPLKNRWKELALNPSNAISGNVNDVVINSIYENKRNCELLASEIQVGLRWDETMFREKVYLKLQLGWEYETFINFNHLFFFTQLSSNHMDERTSNLGLRGLTASAQLDF